MNTKKETFEKSFRLDISSIRGECQCGKEFYSSSDDNFFEPGELEAGLTKVDILSDSVGFISISERVYVLQCDCWEKLADKIINFFEVNSQAIARYLTIEKERLRDEAEAYPEVD